MPEASASSAGDSPTVPNIGSEHVGTSPESGLTAQGLSPTTIESVTTEWINGGTTDNQGIYQVTPQGNNFDWWTGHATSPTVIEAKLAYAISGSMDHEPGSIVIRVPAHIFTDRTGATYGTSDLAVPQAPTIGENEFNYTYDAATDEYVLTNCKTVPAASKYTCDVSYSIAHPSDIVSGSTSHPFYANVAITDAGKAPIKASSNQVVAQINTSSTIDRNEKNEQQIYMDWQSSWGDKPQDADDDFYIVWRVITKANSSSNQPYTVTVADTPGTEGGTLVGYSALAFSGNSIDYPVIVDTFSASAPVANVDTPNEGRESGKNTCAFCDILVKYPKTLIADGNKHTFTNSVDSTITGDDDNKASTKTANATFDYTPLVFTAPPGDQFTLNKDGTTTSAGAIDSLLSGKTATARNFSNKAEAQCYDETLRVGGDAANPQDYGQRPYTVELIDDQVYLEGDYDKCLTADDYEVSRLIYRQFSVYDLKADLNIGGYSEVHNYDYATYPDEIFYGQFGTDDWVEIGRFSHSDGTPNGFFTTTMAGASLYNNGYYGIITLPSGCTAVKSSITTTDFAISDQCFELDLTIKPSARVKSLVEGKSEVNITNVNTLVAKDDQGKRIGAYGDYTGAGTVGVAAHDQATYGTSMMHKSANDYLRTYSRYSFPSKSGTVTNDTANKRIDIDYDLKATNSIIYDNETTTANDLIANGTFQLQKTGTFYDLLPKGMVADMGTVNVYGIDQGWTTPCTCEAIPDYRGTGRTMLIVRISGEGSHSESTFSGGASCTSGWDVKFRAYYSWEDAADYGINPLNSAAYETGNDSIAYGLADNGGLIAEKDLMADLDGDGNPEGAPNKFLFMENTVNAGQLVSTEAGLTKLVRADGALTWGDGVKSPIDLEAGGTYQYRLRTDAATGTKLSNVVLYDSLENYTPTSVAPDYGDATWRGTFAGLDLSQPEYRGVAPVVYYSTVPSLDIATHKDLTDTATWSTVAPDDLSNVTAIAVDCSKKTDGSAFELPQDQSLTVLVNMKAPTDYNAVNAYVASDAHAFNQVWEASTVIDTLHSTTADETIHNEYTKVGLVSHPVDLTVAKVWDDADNQDGIRPDSVTVHLLKDGQDTGQSATLDADHGWTATFQNLDEYDGTRKIDYSLSEDAVAGYTMTVAGDAASGLTATNSHTPATVSKTVTKTWVDGNDQDGTRPPSIRVQLYADGAASGDPVTLEAADGWVHTWTGLPKYASGAAIDYTVAEVDVPDGYTAAVTDDGESDAFAIEDSHTPANPDIRVEKSVDKTTAEPGDTLVYTLTVSNDGEGSAQGIWIKDAVPEYTSFVSCDPTGHYGVTRSDKTEYAWWYIDTLDAGASVALTMTVKVDECLPDGTNDIDNVALFSTPGNPPTNPDDNPGTPTNTVTVHVSHPSAFGLMPKTGDGAGLPATMAVGALAVGALAVSSVALRRKRKGE